MSSPSSRYLEPNWKGELRFRLLVGSCERWGGRRGGWASVAMLEMVVRSLSLVEGFSERVERSGLEFVSVGNCEGRVVSLAAAIAAEVDKVDRR